MNTPCGMVMYSGVLEVFYCTLLWYQDHGHDVISRNTVLPSGEWTRSVRRRLYSSVRQFLHSYLLI